MSRPNLAIGLALGLGTLILIAVSCQPQQRHATIISPPQNAPVTAPIAPRAVAPTFQFTQVYTDRNSGVQVKFFIYPGDANTYRSLYPQQVQHYPCQSGFFPALKKTPTSPTPVLTCLAPIGNSRTLIRF